MLSNMSTAHQTTDAAQPKQTRSDERGPRTLEPAGNSPPADTDPNASNTPAPIDRQYSAAPRRWLHGLTIGLVVVTFVLLILGGTVTSHGVGLAVSDWPTSLGYNMFLLPPRLWQGGILVEHTHRLLASFVGFYTMVVCLCLCLTQRHRPWLCWVGGAAVVIVIGQGIMGGLRVTELSVAWGVFHGITAQLFFLVTVLIATATGPLWDRRSRPSANRPNRFDTRLRRCSGMMLAILIIQLILGAGMRHTGSGLAIPDFPTSYGGLVPPFAAEQIEAAHSEIVPYDQFEGDAYPTSSQVAVHFAHRAWAVATLLGGIWLLACAQRFATFDMAILRPALATLALLLVQIGLGALVVISGRHPELATAHQATGAAILATAALLAIRTHALRPAPVSGEEGGPAERRWAVAVG